MLKSSSVLFCGSSSSNAFELEGRGVRTGPNPHEVRGKFRTRKSSVAAPAAASAPIPAFASGTAAVREKNRAAISLRITRLARPILGACQSFGLLTHLHLLDLFA